jgi:NADH:ubiquinone oxidoreductase subunit 3 (subunit A)
MMKILLTPPIALLIYIGLVAILSGFGRLLAGAQRPTPLKSSTYAGGETPPTTMAAPGYRPFFVIALFFAVLHLAVLMFSTDGLTAIAGVYLIGLLVALVALILG